MQILNRGDDEVDEDDDDNDKVCSMQAQKMCQQKQGFSLYGVILLEPGCHLLKSIHCCAYWLST